jgi:hypothetical protein
MSPVSKMRQSAAEKGIPSRGEDAYCWNLHASRRAAEVARNIARLAEMPGPAQLFGCGGAGGERGWSRPGWLGGNRAAGPPVVAVIEKPTVAVGIAIARRPAQIPACAANAPGSHLGS